MSASQSENAGAVASWSGASPKSCQGRDSPLPSVANHPYMADGCYGNSGAPAGWSETDRGLSQRGEEGSQGPGVRVQAGPAQSSWSRTS